MQLVDIEKIVDYFIEADADFLKGMGADKSKLPNRKVWIEKIKTELQKPFKEKGYYYIIWLIDNEPLGHSNINQIKFGKYATMHLHLWNTNKRKKGLGEKFLHKTIPYYFKNFALEKLICEPYSKNIAPNKTLKKIGFEFVKQYETVPGPISYRQTVNRYELTKERLELL